MPFSLTLADIVIPSRCPALGVFLRVGSGRGGHTYQSPTLDRVVPETGYVVGNVVVISHRANAIKSSASVHEMESVLRYYRKQVLEKK